jgi:hypothetical protein
MHNSSVYVGWRNLQIRNSSLCEYFEFAEKPNRSKKQIDTKKNLTKTYSGEVSKLSKKNISRALQLLLQSSPLKYYDNPITGKRNSHRLTFITLTFPCNNLVLLSEEYTKSLKPFLRWLKEVKKCDDYIWKAEYQKRGQLHYHITTNQFIRHDEIRSKWNSIMHKNNYLIDYFNKTGHYNAPSTDIAAVKKIDDIESYLIKYMMKEVKCENDEVNNDLMRPSCKGKIFGSSERLRGKKYYTIINVNENIEKIIDSQIQAGNLTELDNIEHCRYFKIKKKSDFSILGDKSFKTEIINYAKSHFKSSVHFNNYNNNVGCSHLLDSITEIDKRIIVRKKLVEKFYQGNVFH